jgi:hypothetical protein
MVEVSDGNRLEQTSLESRTKHYFVDEAGDLTFFDKHHKKLIVGTPGCSKFFILGMLDIADPIAIADDMERLRERLCDDPKYPTLPCNQNRNRNTAILFHAKNDHPSVRSEVFSLLLRHDVRFLAVVTDKLLSYEYHSTATQRNPTHRFDHNSEYDYHARCLFTHRVHRDDKYTIHIANRGLRSRAPVLQELIWGTRHWYLNHYRMSGKDCQIVAHGRESKDLAGLQATDYMLWALQRLYERKDSHFLEQMWSKCSLINDRHLPGRRQSGVYFTRKDPQSLASLLKSRGI